MSVPQITPKNLHGAAYYFEGTLSAEHPRKPPAAWTHYYWPIALLISGAAFLAADALTIFSPAWALWAGVFLLAGPETAMAVLGLWNNTFSVWVWNTLKVTQGQPIQTWRASHFLALGGYLVLVATICSWIAHHEAIGWTVMACWLSLWLTFHFFWHKFT